MYYCTSVLLKIKRNDFNRKYSVADPGEGSSPPPLFLDQTEAQRAKKFVWETSTPPPPRPPYLRVWMTSSHLILKSASGTDTTNVLIKMPSQKAIYIYLK